MVDKKAKGDRLKTAPTATKCGPHRGIGKIEVYDGEGNLVQVIDELVVKRERSVNLWDGLIESVTVRPDPRQQPPARKEQKPL